MILKLALITSCLALAAAAPAQTTPIPQTNTSIVDPDGTAHVTRVVPVPADLSPEAEARMRHSSNSSVAGPPQTLEQQRAGVTAWHTGAAKKSLALFPVTLSEMTLAGVPVRDVRPISGERPGYVLLNVHGGGFTFDSGSLTESIPMANLTRIRVVSVLYRLAPEHPFPAQLDDAVAVYRELLKTYQPSHIALYGTSAGAILTGEIAVRLRQLGLPLPAALGIFSGTGDLSTQGDSDALFTLQGLAGAPAIPNGKPTLGGYLAGHDPKDPVVSPIYADLHGFPPTLFLTSERDALLSDTVNLHRAFLRAGVDARLVVFDVLAHTFWNEVELPESREAYGYMANFFLNNLHLQPLPPTIESTR